MPLGLVALEDGHFGGAVHVAEVGRVDAVLGHLLPRRGDLELAGERVAELLPHTGCAELGHLGDLPLRLGLVRVVPGHDQAVALDHRVGAQPGLGVGALAVRDVRVAALGIERPGVERAHDGAPVDAAAHAEVRTEVGAVGVVQVGGAVGVAPQHGVGAEHVPRQHLLLGQFVRPAEGEPAERDGPRPAFAGGSLLQGCAHRSSPNTRTALSRRNFGHTSSRSGTFGNSRKMRSRLRPIGK